MASTEDATRLRDSVADLASAMAQPALWIDGKPPDTVRRVLDAVIGRTSDLIVANERLTKELAERRATEAALRANELTSPRSSETRSGRASRTTGHRVVRQSLHRRETPGTPLGAAQRGSWRHVLVFHSTRATNRSRLASHLTDRRDRLDRVALACVNHLTPNLPDFSTSPSKAHYNPIG